MKIKKQSKLLMYVSLFMLLVFVGSSFVIAKELRWFEKQKPSDVLTVTEKTQLISSKDKYVWNTTRYWYEGNCYYFDLYIGNSTNITWSDYRRELTCQKNNLSLSQIETLQLENVAWTLKELSKDVIVQTPTTTQSEKGENIKDQTIKDGTTVYDNTLKVVGEIQ